MGLFAKGSTLHSMDSQPVAKSLSLIKLLRALPEHTFLLSPRPRQYLYNNSFQHLPARRLLYVGIYLRDNHLL
jgi:hypothetical protein